MRIASVGWSVGKSPDAILEIWGTAALLEAVLAALLRDPEGMRKALEVLGSGP